MDDINSKTAAELKDQQMKVAGEKMLARALSCPQQEFGSFFLSRLMGFEVSYGEDTCSVCFTVEAPMSNPQGSLHGGVIATAMDISMGHLLRRHHGPGATLEMKVQYLAAVRSGKVTATARFMRSGRSINFLQSVLTGADGAKIAAATSTWKVLKRDNG